jgi:hypothetical protein
VKDSKCEPINLTCPGGATVKKRTVNGSVQEWHWNYTGQSCPGEWVRSYGSGTIDTPAVIGGNSSDFSAVTP